MDRIAAPGFSPLTTRLPTEGTGRMPIRQPIKQPSPEPGPLGPQGPLDKKGGGATESLSSGSDAPAPISLPPSLDASGRMVSNVRAGALINLRA